MPDAIVAKFGEMGFSAARVRNAETMAEIGRVADETGWAICPHTAVGTLEARRRPRDEVATVVLATAHAAKFPETFKEATGLDIPLPARCADIEGRGEVFEQLPASAEAVLGYVREHCGKAE